MIKLHKDFSNSVKKHNNVRVQNILDYINVYHEILQEEFPECMQDHPHMELFSDGSGSIVSSRERMADITKKYGDRKYKYGILMSFSCLKEFIKITEDLIKKHKVVWQ